MYFIDLTSGVPVIIISANKFTSNETCDEEKYPAQQSLREFRMVESERKAAGEWTSEGGSNGLVQAAHQLSAAQAQEGKRGAGTSK